MNENNYVLKDGEKIEYTATISKKALIPMWLSAPTFVILPYIITYVPQLIKSLIDNGIKKLILGEASLPSAPSVWDFLPEEVGLILAILILIPVVFALLVWVVICLFLTRRHYKNSLVVTDSRVIGKSVDGQIDEELTNIKNVCLEQPLFGKVFNYGAIVITGKRQSLTIRNIDDPNKVYKMLLTYAENY